MDITSQVSVCLVEVETTGNIGSVARAMKNFDCRKLILFNPKTKITGETMGFAMHARDVVEKAQIIQTGSTEEERKKGLEELFASYHLVVGTSAKTGEYRNIARLVTPLPHFEIPSLETTQQVLFVFGRESIGLLNEELDLIDLLVHIPASEDYPTLNIAHAVAVVMYDLFQKVGSPPENRAVVASRRDKNLLLDYVQELIEGAPRIREHRKDRTYHAFKNLINRAHITRKERNLIVDLFKKVIQVIQEDTD